MEGERIIVERGAVRISDSDILETKISTCVSICLYHPKYGTGGITHISRSRKTDTTPSGKYIKRNGYYYAARAIPRLLQLFCSGNNSIRERSLRFVLSGGVNNEGPILETMSELEKYDFMLIGEDINQGYHRHVMFDTAHGIVHVRRKVPFTNEESIRVFYLT